MEVAPKEQTSVNAVVSIVKGEDVVAPSTPLSPPTSPSKLKDPTSVDEELPSTVTEIPTVEGDVVKKSAAPSSFNAFPIFKPTWDMTKGSVSSPLKPIELSPEAALVEFISTSASFYNVKQQDMKSLELDILKVFTNNVMPANAAAWYMAKRNFYLDKPYPLQLLPYLLKHYPKKFQVIGQNRVEFLETFNTEVARRKMQYLVHQGLFAYFSHKADEYGVYFFDPMYYETTEPYHANLRLVTNSRRTHHSKLIQTYFNIHKSQFQFIKHSPYLVSISKIKTETVVNTTGVIHSMINNLYGIIKFCNGSETEKALFSAKSLFKDGYVYDRDPMNMPAIQFDGYKIPGNPKAEGKEYTWYAVLVWTGNKPSPKFCATKEALSSSQFFQNQPVTFAQLSGLVASAEAKVGPPPPVSKGQKLDDSMRIGEVIEIRKNGAVVLMHKNGDKKAFIPGWAHKIARKQGAYLTTTLAVTLAMGDLIAFYMDPKQKAAPYYGVGCNVLVLKHANSGDAAVKVADEVTQSKSKSKYLKKKGAKTDDDTSSGEKGDASKSQQIQRRMKTQRRTSRRDSKISESSADVGRKRTKSQMSNFNLKEFLLSGEILEEDVYDSDDDPTFMPPPIFNIDHDYDEYSCSELEDDEVEKLTSEATGEMVHSPEYLAVVAAAAEAKTEGDSSDGGIPKQPFWVKCVMGEDEAGSEDEKDQDYIPPFGLDLLVNAEKLDTAEANAAEETAEASPPNTEEEDDSISEPEIDAEELNQLLAESKLPLEEVVRLAKVTEQSPDELELTFAKLAIVSDVDEAAAAATN